MSIIIDPRQLPVIEFGAVPEIFADGIGLVEMVGRDWFRTTFHVALTLPQTCVPVRVPVCRIVRPIDSYVPNLVEQLIKAELAKIASGVH